VGHAAGGGLREAGCAVGYEWATRRAAGGGLRTVQWAAGRAPKARTN
jgi:hypothetical protein